VWAWWHYVAKRTKHLGDEPMMLDHPTLEEDAKAFDAYENEPIIWMATNGHLDRGRARGDRDGDGRGPSREPARAG
jgi:hypothetical protein